MSYWQLFYHLVWATKNREPFLTPAVETQVYGSLTSKAVGLRGIVYALGGTVDHVHMVVSIPPTVAVARFVGQVKGVASAHLNKSGLSPVHFAWQDGYGAFSFDAKRLPNFVAYAQRQKEHHTAGTLIPLLERLTAEDVGPRLMGEAKATYAIESETWRRDLRQIDTVTGENEQPTW